MLEILYNLKLLICPYLPRREYFSFFSKVLARQNNEVLISAFSHISFRYEDTGLGDRIYGHPVHFSRVSAQQ